MNFTVHSYICGYIQLIVTTLVNGMGVYNQWGFRILRATISEMGLFFSAQSWGSNFAEPILITNLLEICWAARALPNLLDCLQHCQAP